MQYKIIKISDTHYIIVDNSEITKGDWCYNIAHKLIVKSTDAEWANSNSDNLKKITHSTQILSEECRTCTGACEKCVEVTKPLSVSEVQEIIKGYSVEKLIGNLADEYSQQFYGDFDDNHTEKIANNGFKAGFKAYQELVKDKLFTIDDMENAYKAGSKRTYICEADGKDKKCYCKSDDDCDYRYYLKFEDYIKSILPPTEWDIEFIDGKIKLV